MEHIPYKSRNKSAQSLIEMLIAMTIFAVGVIGITALNASSFRTVKDNELEDLANQHMVKTLEYLKTGTTLNVTNGIAIQKFIEDAINNTNSSCYNCNNSPTDQTVCFHVTTPIDSTGNILNLAQVDEGANGGCVPITSCPNTYKLNATDPNLSGFQVCNQIIVTRVTSGEDGYMITSRINYQLGNRIPSSGSFFVNEIIGFRPFTF